MATKKRLVRKPVSSDPPHLTLTSFSIENRSVFGAGIEMLFAPRRTVLVGKNGAGKSLILESIFQAKNRILHSPGRDCPESISCTFKADDNQDLHYTYKTTSTLGSEVPPDEDVYESIFGGDDLASQLESTSSWEERCWSDSSTKPIWAVSHGKASVQGGKEIQLPPGSSLLSVVGGREQKLPAESRALALFFRGIRLLRAGPLRSSIDRDRVLLSNEEKLNALVKSNQPRIQRLAAELLHWSEFTPERLVEFTDIGRELGTWWQVEIKSYISTGGESDEDAPKSVNFDGVNIGLLSDGTLRVVATIAAILSTRQGGLLLLEEPETGIHPGLLSRLLSVLDSYSADRQLAVSTHSYQVVNWASPQEVRLVERVKNVTRVAPLSKQQIQRMAPYLEETGTLGDFIYSGGTDA